MSHGDICASMFIEVTYTSAKIWKLPKCPSIDEWTKKILREGSYPRVMGMVKHRKSQQ